MFSSSRRTIRKAIAASQRARFRPQIELLESRRVLATLVALTTDNELLTFDSASPETILRSAEVIGTDSALIGIDYRPATGELFGSTRLNLYKLDAASGQATLVGGFQPFGPNGTDFGFDFNPTVDRLRVVSNFDQNLRVNPNNALIVDGATGITGTQPDGRLNYVVGDVNEGENPRIVGSAYLNNDNNPTTGTELYGIDADRDTLVSQDPPNSGGLNTVGPLGVNTNGEVGFDIASNNNGTSNTAFASLSNNAASSLYTIDLETGAATLVGAFSTSFTVRDITVVVSQKLIFGVSQEGNLVSFNSGSPGVLLSNVAVTGLQTGEVVLGIDFRPATGELVALGSNERLYTIDTQTGTATFVSALTADPNDTTDPFTGLAGTSFGTDFNPTVDRLRVVSNSGQNLRINVDTGIVITDTDLNPPAFDVVASAYTNNFPGATETQLFGIDATTDRLVLQASPNDGTLVPVGAGLGVNVAEVVSFDVSSNGIAYAALRLEGQEVSKLYRINLTSGSASIVRSPNAPSATFSAIGGINGGAQLLRGMSVAPAVVQLTSGTLAAVEGELAAVRVIRSGNTSGIVSVQFTTSDGSATAGADYEPRTFTLTFGRGETIKQFFIPIIDDTEVEASETINLTLSTPTDGGGATLGAIDAAILAIADNDGTSLASDSFLADSSSLRKKR